MHLLRSRPAGFINPIEYRLLLISLSLISITCTVLRIFLEMARTEPYYNIGCYYRYHR